MRMRIGEYLKTVRGTLSLREAAAKSGLSHSYIHSLEKGKHPRTDEEILPSPDTLCKLSVAYNHPYHDLMQKAGYLKSDHPEVDFLDHVTLEISDEALTSKFKLVLDGRELTVNETEQFISFLRAIRYGGSRV